MLAYVALRSLGSRQKILSTGQRLSADEAQKIGFVDEVYGDGLSLAQRMGQIVSDNALLSIGVAKMVLNSLCANAAPLTSDEMAAILDQAVNRKNGA
ncbi:hypothetical protein ACN1C3_13955 [Pseudomonas sp. H11T01]|uniref:hypothetical protein n=1 Tax=Pseudomonas sp. H11T01 TaxID=3402749 RepID=UPI003AD326EE